MEIETLFFDTYAFFEIIKGNQNYRRFSKDIAIMTTKLNLMDLYYGILITKGEQDADKYYDKLTKFAVDIDNDIIKEAMKFRAKNKDRNLSYADCIGYIIALKNNIKFLTGDEQFKDLQDAEFVK
ncbi:PIN domain-containing protein [archaeon]|nr:PIN domain-containing protein [archaeon]